MNNTNVHLSIIVPCFNESDNIPDLLEQTHNALQDFKITWEIILIDDGSSDSTKLIIKNEINKYSNLKYYEHPKNLGIVESWKTGFQNSKGDYILTTDADLQYSPNDIPILFSNFNKENFDLIQGFRKFQKQKSLKRIFMSKFFSILLNIFFKMRLNDIKSGFVLYKKNVFANILKTSEGFRYFQHFNMISANALNYKIQQYPITFYPRFKGQSFIKDPTLFAFKALLDFPLAIKKFKKSKA